MDIILHDPIISDIFVQFINRCNYLINTRNNIDHVENLQINNKIPRDDFENNIDYTSSREDIHIDPNNNTKELFNLSNQCKSSQTFEDVSKQINNLNNIKLYNSDSNEDLDSQSKNKTMRRN